jgi:hypothetical protein
MNRWATRLACVVFIAWAAVATTRAAPLVHVGNSQYDELIDRGTTVGLIYGQGTDLDCATPPVVARTGNDFRTTVLRYEAGGSAVPCPFGRLRIELGNLARGDYKLTVTVATVAGTSLATSAREFHVRPYVGSCNRFPYSGSVVNVFHPTLNGTGIANLLAANPALAAELGNPVVSLTWYNNAGAQLVYPTPEDPVQWYDRALATGLFRNVGMMRGRYCDSGIPPPDVQSDVIEFRNADFDAYFYATAPDEIASLDSGAAWKRTGKSFRAITQPCTDRQDLHQAYRFFGRPGAGPTSHVFTIDQEECHAVNRSGAWIFEGVAFYAERTLRDGSCAYAERTPLYRVWRPFGESRHRFTTERAVVAEQTAQGWVDEGPVMCVVH